MPIIKAAPPSAMNALAAQRFIALKRAKGELDANLEAGGGAAFPIDNCFRIYHVNNLLESLTPTLTSAATPVGWKYVLRNGDTTESVDVIGDKVSAIERGRSVSILNQSLQYATARLPNAAKFEARLLTFGRSGASLLWIHGATDHFFTISGKPEEISTEAAFLSRASAARVRQIQRAHRTLRKESGEPDDDESGG